MACKGTSKKRTSKKGISPLVAAVLLIAVTMTIAGFLAYWAASFVKTSLPEVNQTEINCKLADFIIDSCSYDSTARTVTIALRNTKDIELKALKVFLYYPNKTISDPISLDGSLGAGGMLKSFTINDVNETFTRLAIGTHCSELIREKVCASS